MERTLSPTSLRYSIHKTISQQFRLTSFKYTTQLSVDATPALVLPQPNDANNLVPVQIIFVLKAKNQKKINSHRWLFNAIGKMLNVGLLEQ